MKRSNIDAVRLQKHLADLGFGSRRQLETWIEAGRISVNGKRAELGIRVAEGDVVRVDGRRVDKAKSARGDTPRVLCYHKPVGEICSRHDARGRPSAFRALPSLKTGRWMMFILCLSCVVFVFEGCSQKEPVEGNSPSNLSPAIDSEPAAPSSVEPIVAGGDTKETARLWSDSIKSQLAQIADALVKDQSAGVKAAAGAKAPAALANRIEMVDPDLLQAKEVYHGQSVKVVEVSLPDGIAPSAVVQAETDEFIRRIRELLFITPNAPEDTVHFKLFGIDGDGEHLQTRQRLTARGTREGKPVRSYAVVDATWVTPAEEGDDKPPRLVGFSMPMLVLCELISEPTVMFEDIASSVLGGNPAWSKQLRLGMNTWVRHIDRSLNPDFLGYHGLAIGDVDGDDLEDLYLCQPGGLPNLLFRQQTDGTLVDISKAARVDWLDNSTGALLVDLDNDGDADLAVSGAEVMPCGISISSMIPTT